MDLSQFTPEQLKQIAETGVVPDGSLPGDGSNGPLVVNVGGQQKSINEMTPHELRAIANDPPERGWVDAIGHKAGVGARAALQGAASGVLGLPGMIADSAAGVGRDIAYAGANLASAVGARDAPDPEKYGLPKSGWSPNWLGGGDDAPSAFPISALAVKAGKVAPDAVGLPEPETATERYGSAAIEGVASGLSGAGAGALLGKLGPAAAKGIATFMAAEPKGQAAAGALGGVGSQGAMENGYEGMALPAGVTASMLPLFLRGRGAPRITSASEEGQRRIAGQVLRNAADDPQAAIANLENAGNTRIKDFQHTTPNAAKDYGIASIQQPLHDFANNWDGGAPAKIEAHNNAILSEAFDNMGARGGQHEATRAHANARTGAATSEMGLASLPNENITDLINHLEQQSSMRTQGVRAEHARDAADMRQMLIDASRPIIRVRADGTQVVVGHSINPDRLHAVRTDIAQGARPNAGTDKNASSGTRYARGLSRDVTGRIDGRLNEATGGAYSEYLREQRAIRGHADTQEFMQDIVNKSSLENGNFRTSEGARQIRPGSFLSRMSEVNIDRPLPSGNRSMSVERLNQLDPIKGSFLRGVEGDLQDANFQNQRGLQSRGSSTARNKDFRDQIVSEVKANSPLVDRAMEAAVPWLNAVTNTVGRVPIGGPIAGGVTRIGANIGGRIAEGRAATRVQAVQGQLGRAFRPEVAAELMKLDPINNPKLGDVARRNALRAAQYGTQGFLAGERSSRYR